MLICVKRVYGKTRYQLIFSAWNVFIDGLEFGLAISSLEGVRGGITLRAVLPGVKLFVLTDYFRFCNPYHSCVVII